MTEDSCDNIIDKTDLKALGNKPITPSPDKDNFRNKIERLGSDADINAWADYWFYGIGVNVIPADTKNKSNK